MKKLWFAFLALLLGCNLAWATPKTVTIHGSITAPANLPSNTLTIWVGTAGDSPIQLKEIPLPATEFRFTAELNGGASVYFNLGFSSGENKEWAIYPSQDDKRSQDYFFETPEGQKNRYWLTLADWDNPFATEPEGGWDDYTFDLKIVAKGGPKASLIGIANYEGNYSTCANGITVAISGDGYSNQTTTEYGDPYYDKVGCSYAYEFTNLDLGTYTLTYSKEGFVTQTKQVEITEAKEIVVESVTLAAKPVEYVFEGYIKYLNIDNDQVYVEGAKITAYDGDGENANVVGEPVHTDANGHWSMTVTCKANATLYFFAEHPNIVVTGRKSAQAVYTSGNNVEIPCTENIPELLGFETYKVKQVEVTVNGETKPGVEISWTWPRELIDNYKKSENDAEGVYKITSIKIKRPIPMAGLTAVGEIQTSGYELPATSFIDGKNPNYLLEAGKTYTYTIEITYSHPVVDNVTIENGADDRLKITLQAGTVAHDSVTLALTANNPAWGTVEGAGKYEKNDQVLIRAKANRGYVFKEWQKDGQTYAITAECKITLTQDLSLEAVFEERPAIYDSVTITLTPNDPKMGKVVGAGRYAKGEEVTIEAVPNDGYAFKQWKAGTMILSAKKAYTFIANTDSSITAVFEREITYRTMINCKAKQIAAKSVRLDWAWPQELKDEYKKSDGTGLYQIASVNIKRRASDQSTPDNIGTIRPSAYQLPVTYYTDCSEEFPLEVGATYIYFLEVNYEEPAFKTVTVNNDGADPNLSVTVVDEVAPVQYYTLILTVNNEEMGIVAASGGNAQYMEGDEVTVTATAKPGYVFQCWKEGNTVVSNAAIYTFKITGHRTLMAEFAEEAQVEKVTLTLNCDQTKGSVNGAGEYAVGTQVTATAIPNADYVFEAWKEGETTVSTEAIYTFTIEENRTLEAVFAEKSTGGDEEPEYVTINVEVDEAMGTVTGAGQYEKGTYVTVTATANDGYIFKGWKENGGMLDAEATYRFMANTDRTLTAVFTDTVNVTLFVNNAAMGTVTGDGPCKIGSEVTVTATPNEGYVFQSWTVNRVEVSTEAEFTLVVYSDTALMAVFAPVEKVKLTLEVNDEDMGTVSGEGEYPKGSSVTVKATPKEGYAFRAWKEGEKVVSTDTVYTFVLNEACTLTAVFAENVVVGGLATLTLAVNDETMGTVTGAGIYKKGTEVTVKAFANEGYVFEGWQAGEETVSTDAEYTFVLNETCTLTAVFAENIVVSEFATLTLSVNDEMMGMVFGEGTYKKETEVTVKAFANDGYVFKAWQAGGETVSTDAEYTFTITEDMTLMAVFAESEANEDVELAAWNVFAENGRIVLHSNTDCRYEVYTLGGILVKQGEMHTNACRIAVDNGGLYIVRRISSTGISVRKVVVR